MTITRPQQRTRKLLIIALFLSVLLHLVGGGLWGLFARVLARMTPKPIIFGSLQEPPLPKAEPIIHIEHLPKAAARQAHENRVTKVALRPHPVVTVAPSLPHPRHEIARIHLHAPAEPPAEHLPVSAVQTPRHAKPVAMAAPVPNSKPALSDKQIAQLGQEFSKTIADSKETLADVQSQSEQVPVTTIKHYTIHFSGIHEGMNPGDGEIIAVSKQRIGNTMWYYTRYTYMHADGTYEADTIPWPFHYPIGDDPFARHDKRIPLQPPPDGYKPDRPLKPILQQFFGGPPVTD